MNQSTLNLAGIGHPKALKAAFDWWLDELRQLVPGGISDSQEDNRSRIVLDVIDDSVSTSLINGDSDTALAPVSKEDFGQGVLREQILSFWSDDAETVIQISNAATIRTTLTLPAATAENLRAVIGFEMDRHTPFTAESVYFHYDILDRTKESIHIELVVIPKADLAPILNALEHMDIPVDEVAVLDDENQAAPLQLDILAPASRKDERLTHRHHSKRLGRVALILAAIAYMLPAAALSLLIMSLNNDVERMQADASDVIAIQRRLQDSLKPAEFFSQLRNDTPRAISVLDELTRLLPQNTWVSHFQIEKQVLKIEGESSDAAALIGVLEQSEFFANSKFTSPVTRNPSNNKDRFTIETSVQGEPDS